MVLFRCQGLRLKHSDSIQWLSNRGICPVLVPFAMGQISLWQGGSGLVTLESCRRRYSFNLF